MNDPPVIMIRDSWDSPGYRLYEADSEDARFICQVDGEINGQVYRTISAARMIAESRFPQAKVVRR